MFTAGLVAGIVIGLLLGALAVMLYVVSASEFDADFEKYEREKR